MADFITIFTICSGWRHHGISAAFSSIVSLPVSSSWVLLTTVVNPISPTGLSQSLLASLCCFKSRPSVPSIRLGQTAFPHWAINCAIWMFHITFILRCSPRLCLRTHPFHNLCITYCFNCILSRCPSTAICWRYTAFCIPFPFIFI